MPPIGQYDLEEGGEGKNTKGNALQKGGEAKKTKDSALEEGGEAKKTKGNAFEDGGEAKKTRGTDYEEGSEAKKTKGNDLEEGGEEKKIEGNASEQGGDEKKTKGNALEEGGEAKKTKGNASNEGGDAKKTKDNALEEGGEAKKTEGNALEEGGEAKKTKGNALEEGGDAKKTKNNALEEVSEAKKTKGNALEEGGEEKKTEGNALEESGEAKKTNGNALEEGGDAKKTKDNAFEEGSEAKKTKGNALEDASEEKETEGNALEEGGDEKKTKGNAMDGGETKKGDDLEEGRKEEKVKGNDLKEGSEGKKSGGYDLHRGSEAKLPKGTLTPDVARYFDRLFPTRQRVDLGEGDDGVLLLPQNEFVPSCFLAMPSRTFSRNVVPRFVGPISKEAKYFQHGNTPTQAVLGPGGILHGGQSFRQATPTSLILSIFPQKAKNMAPFEVLLDEKSCDGNLCVMPIVERHSLDFVSEHNWPSGASVHDDQGRLHYLIHAISYDAKHIVKDRDGDLKRVDTPGFDGLGGENIGSLFLHKGQVYAAARVSLRYNFHTWSGHGYRLAGIWNITDGSLVSMFDDAPCGRRCGYKEQLASNSCEVDNARLRRCSSNRVCVEGVGQLTHHSSKYLMCQSIDPESGERCFLGALRTRKSKDCEALAEYYKCAVKCRVNDEIYHSAATHHKGLLVAVAAIRKNNDLLLCRLGDVTLKFACWPNPIMKLTRTLAKHPLMTQLGFTLNRIFLVEQKRARGGPAGTVVHSWDKKKFCSIAAQSAAAPAELQIRLRVESGTFDGFRLYWEKASGLAGGAPDFDLKSLTNVTLTCRNETVALREEVEPTSLVSTYFFTSLDCAVPFHLLLSFTHVLFVGISK